MQFSLKKTDSSGFFYVLTVVTYTQRSFRAEEPGASEVLSSIFCHHTFYTTRIRFLSTHTVALSQEGVFHHERICLIASNKFHHLFPHLQILLIQAHQGVYSDLLYVATKFTSDPNNLSSTKTHIFLLARKPGGSHFQSEGVKKQVFYLFFMVVNSRSCASLLFYICLISAFSLRKFFFFLNPVPSLCRTIQHLQVSQSSHKTPSGAGVGILPSLSYSAL